MTSLALAENFVTEAPTSAGTGVLSDVQHDPHLHVAIGRMLDFCNQCPMSAPFTARGIVVDTTADITAQLREFFPSHIDLSPVIERIADVCLERARATGQYLQVVSFDHLKQIKPIDSDEGNLETFIEVFADRRVKISSYTGIKTALKAGGGGSGGGDPQAMLAEIRQADIQGFALQIKSLDISDAKATELLAKMGIAQAFAGDGPAIAGALEVIAKGGAEGKALQAVVEQIAEIKGLQAALTNAPDAGAAAPIAAAIALKTETLSTQVKGVEIAMPQVASIIKVNIAQSSEILTKMGIGQAFGGDARAIKAALETIAKGGPEAKAMQTVIEQVSDIKMLRTALTNADPVAAAPIAAAIAIKTEALSAQVQSIQAITPQASTIIQANVTKTVEGVKTVLAARQIESVVTQLSAVLPAGLVRVANDLGRNTMSVQVARAVAAVQMVARNSDMPVRDVIALVMSKNASPAMVTAVEGLTTLMAKPEFLPTIEKGVPPAVALSVRETLTTPVLQAVANTPVQIASVTRALNTLAEKSGVPTIASAAAILNVAGQRVAVESVAPALNVPRLQAVIDNLQAVALTKAVPGGMKAELSSVTAQVQALTVQMRSPEVTPLPTAPQPLPPQAALKVLADTISVKTPAQMPPAAPEIASLKGAPNHWGESPAAPSERRTTNVVSAPAPTSQDNSPVARAADTHVRPTTPVGSDVTPTRMTSDVTPVRITPTTPEAAPVRADAGTVAQARAETSAPQVRAETPTVPPVAPVPHVDVAPTMIAPVTAPKVEAAPAQAEIKTPQAAPQVDVTPVAAATVQAAPAQGAPLPQQADVPQQPLPVQQQQVQQQQVQQPPVQTGEVPRTTGTPRVETTTTGAPVSPTGHRVIPITPEQPKPTAPVTKYDDGNLKSAAFMDPKKGADKAKETPKVDDGCGTCKGEKGCCKAFEASTKQIEAITQGIKDAREEMRAMLKATPPKPTGAAPR